MSTDEDFYRRHEDELRRAREAHGRRRHQRIDVGSSAWRLEVDGGPAPLGGAVGFRLHSEDGAARGWEGDVHLGGGVFIATDSNGLVGYASGTPERFIALGKAFEGLLGEIVERQSAFPPPATGDGGGHGTR